MSNLEKIIKIAANSSFNNSAVTTLTNQVTALNSTMIDVSSNYLDKRNPVLTQHFTVDDMSGNAASFDVLYVNGTSITSSGGGGATEEQINQISTNQSNVGTLLTTTQTHTAEILDISATRLPNIITDVSFKSIRLIYFV